MEQIPATITQHSWIHLIQIILRKLQLVMLLQIVQLSYKQADLLWPITNNDLVSMVVFYLIGSQRSFINIDVFRALDLIVILNERLFLNVFDDIEQKIHVMVVAKLFLKCRAGGRNCCCWGFSSVINQFHQPLKTNLWKPWHWSYV